MTIQTHLAKDSKIAEVMSDDLVIRSAQDGADLAGNLYYQDFDKVILHEKNITPDFFDLKTGIAGEILQKFSNFRSRLAVVGDFRKYDNKSTVDFIYESNKNGQVSFVASLEEALKILSDQT